MLLLLASWTLSSSSALPVSGATCGRMYEGIGGLINSDAPWLKGFPDKQRSDILDVLFKPKWAASLQVLKLEIGGDGHSTINTESSHMHTEEAPPSFKRGWIFWLLKEAKMRNPDLKIGGLAWSWPGWTKGSVDKKVSYLTTWVKGVKDTYNVTVDFMGLQNEGAITGGSPAFAVALRKSLDAAGFQSVLIDCCDSHDFGFLSDLTNHSTDFFKAVGALAVHEPLRNQESVPQAALDTGKPIWSSESYTTYSDANGGGCWARAMNWGYVKGNVTRHIAWNLIQAYPFIGSGMNYMGHGLMWATVPWAGHYVVNPPIWVSAHYTQATMPGWTFLPVGSGSGMLPSGGSYVSLVSERGCGGAAAGAGAGAGGAEEAVSYTMVVQTMQHDMSACFKDTHPPFDVENQTVSFKLDSELLGKIGTQTLYARRTVLVGTDKFDPVNNVPKACSQSSYFAPMPNVSIGSDGTFTLQLGVNEVWTITTVATHRGDDSVGPNLGLAPIPNATPFTESLSSSLTGFPVDSPMIDATIAIDQQGVWEAVVSRDTSLATTTMQQVIPEDCDEWHNAKVVHPQTFIGASANLTGNTAAISAEVLAPTFASGWVGVGIGYQAGAGTAVKPGSNVFAYWNNGSWAFGGKAGSGPASSTWVTLALRIDVAGVATAAVDGKVVAAVTPPDYLVVNDPAGTDTGGDGGSNGGGGAVGGPPHPGTGVFAYLAASWSAPMMGWSLANNATATTASSATAAPQATFSNSEFKLVQVNVTASTLPIPTPPGPPPPPPGPPGPPPPPPHGHGLVLAECDGSNPQQAWTFSGEDGGEAGTFLASSNVSLCLDVSVYEDGEPVLLLPCSTTTNPSQMWTYSSQAGQFASAATRACKVKSHGKDCHICLDVMSKGGGLVDLFDCKSDDSNQVWTYDPAAGASSLKERSAPSRCLQLNP